MGTTVVEDDPDVSGMVAVALRRDGHVVELASTGPDAVWMATEFDFDVVVLDWELPSMDGIEVCRTLRDRGRWMPIIMVTGNGEVDQRVTGLRAGADDYLTKPFAVAELSARLGALLARRTSARRCSPSAPNARPGEERTVQRRGGHARCAPGVRPARAAGPAPARSSTAEILDQVWDLNFDGMSNVVDAHVKSLRAKVDKPFERDDHDRVAGGVPPRARRLSGGTRPNEPAAS
ncbi:MAG: response regulator transcription factor [Acidimicrobiales bacterium]